MMNMTDMVKHLLIINIIFFVGSFMVPNSSELLALHYFAQPKAEQDLKKHKRQSNKLKRIYSVNQIY